MPQLMPFPKLCNDVVADILRFHESDPVLPLDLYHLGLRSVNGRWLGVLIFGTTCMFIAIPVGDKFVSDLLDKYAPMKNILNFVDGPLNEWMTNTIRLQRTQRVELSRRSQTAVEIVSKPSSPSNGGPIYYIAPLGLTFLTSMLKYTLNTNIIPHIWKLANISPHSSDRTTNIKQHRSRELQSNGSPCANKIPGRIVKVHRKLHQGTQSLHNMHKSHILTNVNSKLGVPQGGVPQGGVSQGGVFSPHQNYSTFTQQLQLHHHPTHRFRSCPTQITSHHIYTHKHEYSQEIHRTIPKFFALDTTQQSH